MHELGEDLGPFEYPIFRELVYAGVEISGVDHEDLAMRCYRVEHGGIASKNEDFHRAHTECLSRSLWDGPGRPQ